MQYILKQFHYLLWVLILSSMVSCRPQMPVHETLIAGMKVLGQDTIKTKNLIRNNTYIRYLLKGTAKQWKKLLSAISSKQSFDQYVMPFLVATSVYKYNTGVTATYPSSKEKMTNQDILNFLVALYGYDIESRTTVEASFSNAIGSQDSKYARLLTQFIRMYQPMFIAYVSEQKGFIKSYHIEKMAKQGPDGLRKIMLQSAISSAYTGAVRAFNANLNYKEIPIAKQRVNKPHQINQTKVISLEGEKMVGMKMVRNSVRIIKGVLADQTEGIPNLEEGFIPCFSSAWALTPLPTYPKTVKDFVKNKGGQTLRNHLRMDTKGISLGQYKQNVQDAFASTLFKVFIKQDLLKMIKQHAKDSNIKYTIAKSTGDWYAHLTATFSL